MTEDRDMATAQNIACCTCGRELPEKMRQQNKHFANCPTELVEEIVDALREARAEGIEEAAGVARTMGGEGMSKQTRNTCESMDEELRRRARQLREGS